MGSRLALGSHVQDNWQSWLSIEGSVKSRHCNGTPLQSQGETAEIIAANRFDAGTSACQKTRQRLALRFLCHLLRRDVPATETLSNGIR